MAKPNTNAFFDLLRGSAQLYDPAAVAQSFASVDEQRVKALAGRLSEYIVKNLPGAVDRRDGLGDYRTNPYVLLTCASVMDLEQADRFAEFLFNTKLYMGLEPSFGKSIEEAFLSFYPIHQSAQHQWSDPPEKLAEFATLKGLSRQDKARARTGSVWREIDKSSVVGTRRYLVSIKSGTNTINDSQVQAMTAAITQNHRTWMEQTKMSYKRATSLDVVIGLTYGTDKTTAVTNRP